MIRDDENGCGSWVIQQSFKVFVFYAVPGAIAALLGRCTRQSAVLFHQEQWTLLSQLKW